MTWQVMVLKQDDAGDPLSVEMENGSGTLTAQVIMMRKSGGAF